MKKKKTIAIIVSFCLMFFLLISNFDGIKVSGDTENKPILTLSKSGDGQGVHLSWTSPDSTKHYSYRIFSKEANETTFQSIPAKSKVKVLNIYPDKGNNLKKWMEEPNDECSNGYGKGLINVDSVSISEFEKNIKNYMKNSDDTWKYDVVMLGSWDANGGKVPSKESVDIFKEFIDSGRGFLAGHDTIGYDWGTTRGLGTIREKFNIKVGYWNNKNGVDEGYNYYGGFIGDKVSIKKKGLLTNYPWNIGDVGTTLSVPTSHSTSNFALGDIWMTYAGDTNNPKLWSNTNIPKELYAQSNFYLTTWNNTAMIQTGHSSGKATADEKKILANTLFYLAQVSEDNEWDDHKGQDLAKPTKPDIKSVSKDITSGKLNVSFNQSTDFGTKYEYYVQATDKETGEVTTSNTESIEVISGLKGYSVSIDEDPNGVPDLNTETNSCRCTLDKIIDKSVYVHVAAVDNAGNMSDVSTYQYIYPKLDLTAEDLNEDTNTVKINAKATGVQAPIKEIILPDGTKVEGSQAEYTADRNDTYTFKAIDEEGNEVTENITVDSIREKVILNVESEKNSVYLQQQFVVDLNIDNVTDIGGIDTILKYDTSKLTLLGFEDVPEIKYYFIDKGNGNLRFTFFSFGDKNFINSKTSLLKLKFKAKAPGDALIDVTKGRITNENHPERDLVDAECGKTTITILNKELKKDYTLADVTMIAKHVGEDPKSLLPDIDVDLNSDGKIDAEDIKIGYDFMMRNPNYKLQ